MLCSTGTGGKEASLFTQEMLIMYQRLVTRTTYITTFIFLGKALKCISFSHYPVVKPLEIGLKQFIGQSQKISLPNHRGLQFQFCKPLPIHLVFQKLFHDPLPPITSGFQLNEPLPLLSLESTHCCSGQSLNYLTVSLNIVIN